MDNVSKDGFHINIRCINHMKSRFDYAFPSISINYSLHEVVVVDDVGDEFNYLAILVFPNPNRDKYTKSYLLIPTLSGENHTSLHKHAIEDS